MTTEPTDESSQLDTLPTPVRAPRRRRAVAAVAVLAIAAGGTFAIVASAGESDGPSLETAAEPEATATTAAPADADAPSGPFGDFGDFGAVSDCFAAELGIEIDPSAGPSIGPGSFEALGDIAPEDMQAAFEACSGLLPEGLGTSFGDFDMTGFDPAAFEGFDMAGFDPAAFEGFDMAGFDIEAISECLGDDIGLGDTGLGAGFPSGPGADMTGVAVITADGPTILHFGEGDGSITVTKAGDTTTVTHTGDVTEVDLPSFGAPGAPGVPGDISADMEAAFAEVQAKLAECGIELPAGLADGIVSGFDMSNFEGFDPAAFENSDFENFDMSDFEGHGPGTGDSTTSDSSTGG